METRSNVGGFITAGGKVENEIQPAKLDDIGGATEFHQQTRSRSPSWQNRQKSQTEIPRK